MKAIMLSCSQTKSTGPAPAIELYDGPRWRTLRAALRQVSIHPIILGFSAEHGIISGDTVIYSYNKILEDSFMVKAAGFQLLDDITFIHLSMGRQYAEYLIPRLSIPYEWDGGRGNGDQRAGIYRFLLKYDMESVA